MANDETNEYVLPEDREGIRNLMLGIYEAIVRLEQQEKEEREEGELPNLLKH